MQQDHLPNLNNNQVTGSSNTLFINKSQKLDIQTLFIKTNLNQENKEQQFRSIVKNLQKEYKIQIQKIKANIKASCQQANQQLLDNDIKLAQNPKLVPQTQSLNNQNPKLSLIETKLTRGKQQTKLTKIQNQFIQKNKLVNEMDKLKYDKKFQNFITHKQEILQKNKQEFKKINKKSNLEIILYKQQDMLSNEDSDFKFENAQQMKNAYKNIFNKHHNNKKLILKQAAKYQYQFRINQFTELLKIEKHRSNCISKQLIINYLFNQIQVMMLYNINPYTLADQLAEFQSSNIGFMTFKQFSAFLLLDRLPILFQYTKEIIQQAKALGKGIKCGPIISKWIDKNDIYEKIVDIIKRLDLFGKDAIQKHTLVNKIRKYATEKNIIDSQIIEIVNINKKISLSRLLFQIEYNEIHKQSWKIQDLKNYLLHYKRLRTKDLDKIIEKQMKNGKYDTSNSLIIGKSALNLIKKSFKQLQKYAQYFVLKSKFINKLISNTQYHTIKNIKVRSQPWRQLKIETIDQTLTRFQYQAQQYCDMQEIIEFFTNKGRPRSIQYQIYLKKLEQSLNKLQSESVQQQIQSDTEDEESFGKIVKDRKKKRLLDKIQQKKRSSITNCYNITVPLPFQFTQKQKNKKQTIRERKLKQMLIQKQKKLSQSLKPIKSRDVPQYVKDNLFEKFKRNQQKKRKQRLEKFRAEIIQKMIPISQRLIKQKPKIQSEVHCAIQKDNYVFVANPIPWYSQVQLLQKLNKQKMDRRQKILEDTINKQFDINLSDGLQQMILRNQEQLKRKQIKTRERLKSRQFTFTPKIKDKVPNFQKIHQNLKIELETRKQQKKPTVPQQFSFYQRSKSEKKIRVSEDIPLSNKKTKIIYKLSQQKVPTTLKHQSLMKLRKQQKQMKKKEINIQKQQQLLKKLKRQKIAPYVHQVLRINREKNNQLKNKHKILEINCQKKQKQYQYQQQLLKIYNNVMNRPLLIQNTKQENQIDQKKKKSTLETTKLSKNKDLKLQEQHNKKKLTTKQQKQIKKAAYTNDNHHKKQYKQRRSSENKQSHAQEKQ